MHLSHNKLSHVVTGTKVLSASLALALFATGCSPKTDNASHESSSSAASASNSQDAVQSSGSANPSDSASAGSKASASASSESKTSASASQSQQKKKNDNNNDQGEDEDGNGSKSSSSAKPEKSKIAENFPGADKLASAKTVDTSHEQVKKTQELYSSYEDVLANVGTMDRPGSTDEKDKANSGENTDTPSKTINEATQKKIDAVSTGSAKDEFTSAALEYATADRKQKGKSTIVGQPKIADTQYNGQPAKILEVCVDSSKVKVKDSAGNDLLDSHAPKRSLNVFTLVEHNGSWKIASHDFPNNPDC